MKALTLAKIVNICRTCTYHISIFKTHKNGVFYSHDNTSRSVVLKVVDIDPQGSIGPSKGFIFINSHGVKWESLNGQGVNE